MEKAPMCRICLAENVRMFIVVNRNLHELYEKLTDIPFVTKDIRPILVCYFCCAKLKQCYQLLQQCLEAEVLFAQRMNGDYEPNPLVNQGRLELFNGFIKSPIVHISIDDECEAGSIIKEELPAVCEGIDSVIEPKDEHQSDELELEHLYNSYLDVADIPSHHSDSDLEVDELLIELKTKVEDEEEPKKKRRARETKTDEPENVGNDCQDLADIPPEHSELDLQYGVPLMKFIPEVEEEVSTKKKRARETTNAPIVKKPKLDTRTTKQADTIITAEQNQIEPSGSQAIQNTRNCTSKRGTTFKEPSTDAITKVHSSIDNTAVHTNTRSSSNKDDLRRKISKEKAVDGDNINSDRRLRVKENPYQCDVCQISFSRKVHLTEHIRIHTGEKPHKCDVCQRSFRLKGYLTKHIQIHTGEKPYKCDVCQHSFNQKGNLTQHIRIHTGEKPHKCDVCQRSFNQMVRLTEHIRIHTGEKPYKCDVCQRSFSRKVRLSEHIRIHTGDKPYKCNVCRRSFNSKGHLTRHSRLHTGEKPFKCDVCQLSFSRKVRLLEHIRIHTGETPYKCDVCQRSFSQKNHLTQHIRIHTCEKPYKCDVCQHSFNQRGNLTQHVRIHTGEKPFKCDVCQLSFSQKSHSNTHW